MDNYIDHLLILDESLLDWNNRYNKLERYNNRLGASIDRMREKSGYNNELSNKMRKQIRVNGVKNRIFDHVDKRYGARAALDLGKDYSLPNTYGGGI